MTTVRRHSSRRYHARPSTFVVKNKESRRNRALPPGRKIHTHSSVRLVELNQVAGRGNLDQRTAVLVLLGALKYAISRRTAILARDGSPPDDSVKKLQRLLPELVALAQGSAESALPVGLFMKRKVVDVCVLKSLEHQNRPLLENVAGILAEGTAPGDELAGRVLDATKVLLL